jgi:hypothetical protein
MDAAADYAAAKAMLTRPLPAYVSYTARSRVKFDAVDHNETDDIVVRTADGVVVKGKVPASSQGVHFSTGDDSGMEPIAHAAFKPRCYEPARATTREYGGRSLEAIELRELCGKSKDDKDFDTLYVDPRTHEPVAATGNADEDHVLVRLEQQFTRVGDHALPSTLYVRVQGSSFMFWLDVLVDVRYSNYRFSSTPP